MTVEHIDTVIVGGGQAGLSLSEHLRNLDLPHLIIEKNRIAERWRTARWDSLVTNGPVWHDRFPTLEFSGMSPEGFATKERVVAYFEEVAKKINAPIRCGVTVEKLYKDSKTHSWVVKTSAGTIEAINVVAATGPYQSPIIPPIIPQTESITQIHSYDYRNPEQLPPGSVLVVGSGSSGAQIAEELLLNKRTVYLSIGPHDRPPRSYRGHDYCWWLGVLGKWAAKTPPPGAEHVTIAVSGAYGGKTVDFRHFASNGMNLLGMTKGFKGGHLYFEPDLKKNLDRGDTNYLSLLDEADEYILKNNIDLPLEEGARIMYPEPLCVTNPILDLDLGKSGITSIVWATGYKQDFSWMHTNVFKSDGTPRHERGVSNVPGIYFLGLPWLSMRGSSFIWGVWEDAKYIAEHIFERYKKT